MVLIVQVVDQINSEMEVIVLTALICVSVTMNNIALYVFLGISSTNPGIIAILYVEMDIPSLKIVI